MSSYILEDHKIISRSITSQIELFKNSRSSQEKEALIYSLILNLTALKESLINEIISNQIEFKCGDNELAKRLIAQFHDELIKDSWTIYIKKIELILGQKVTDFINNETLKTIKFLFQLRNQIAHGNRREYDYQDGIKKLNNKYRIIQDYLFEKKLINSIDGSEIEIFSAKVFNHFLNQTKIFFKEINSKIPEPNHGYIFRNILTSLNSIGNL